MSSQYTYIGIFPVTLPNSLWIGFASFLTISCISIYTLQVRGVVGDTIRYINAIGKHKSTSTYFDFSKRYFTHFYAFGSVWNCACFVTILGLCWGRIQTNWIANVFFLKPSLEPKGDQLSVIIVMAMLAIQTCRRLYECLFTSVFSSSSQMNILQFLWGVLYYLSLAPTLITESMPLVKLPVGQFEIRHLVGIIGFVVGSYLQHQSFVILADLRRKKKVKRESHGLPMGGLFEFVSSPHYFAEMIVYGSELIIIGSQCASWWLLMFYIIATHVNMAVGAHTWYKETFSSYPKNRKALIPFIF